MSTVRATNIGAEIGPTQDTMAGLLKTWANLNGTGVIALRDSFNVSSVVDNGTGHYTFNITNAFANANWRAVLCGQDDGSGGGGTNFFYGAFKKGSLVQTVGSFTGIMGYPASTSHEDNSHVLFDGMGTLAG